MRTTDACKTAIHPSQKEYATPIFSHPDYTVGTGIAPVQSRLKRESRAFAFFEYTTKKAPPVGNCPARAELTLPRR